MAFAVFRKCYFKSEKAMLVYIIVCQPIIKIFSDTIDLLLIGLSPLLQARLKGGEAQGH